MSARCCSGEFEGAGWDEGQFVVRTANAFSEQVKRPGRENKVPRPGQEE